MWRTIFFFSAQAMVGWTWIRPSMCWRESSSVSWKWYRKRHTLLRLPTLTVSGEEGGKRAFAVISYLATVACHSQHEMEVLPIESLDVYQQCPGRLVVGTPDNTSCYLHVSEHLEMHIGKWQIVGEKWNGVWGKMASTVQVVLWEIKWLMRIFATDFFRPLAVNFGSRLKVQKMFILRLSVKHGWPVHSSLSPDWYMCVCRCECSSSHVEACREGSAGALWHLRDHHLQPPLGVSALRVLYLPRLLQASSLLP